MRAESESGERVRSFAVAKEETERERNRKTDLIPKSWVYPSSIGYSSSSIVLLSLKNGPI